MDANEILIKRIQSVLSPDLLTGQWKKAQGHRLKGHCYVATEVLYHLLNDPEWKTMCASYQKDGKKCTHWWLENKNTNEILDPTKEQYVEELPPYLLGKGCGLLTKTPSKRALIVLERIDKVYGDMPVL